MISRRFLLSNMPLAAAQKTPSAPLARSRNLLQRLDKVIETIELGDTHEHFHEERDRVAMRLDFFRLAADSYVLSDLVSAGLSRDDSQTIQDPEAGDKDRWMRFEPYWKRVRFTATCQALRHAVRDLYGIEPSASTISDLNDKIRSSNRPGVYAKVLKDKSHIRFCVIDDSCGGCTRMSGANGDPEMYLLARRFDDFFLLTSQADIERIEAQVGQPVSGVEALEGALEKNFRDQLRQGMRAVKVAAAYSRELAFDETAKPDAERDFQALMRGERKVPEGFRKTFTRPYRALEDYMFHALVRLAAAHGVAMQIHTGVFAGNGNRFTNARVSALINVFLLYPEVKFDIFHLSIPYENELVALARSFPNVYADFCWAYTISPEIARRTLEELLETTPINKILLFGGDYKHPESTYAQAKLARRSAAETLSARVERGWCTEQEAVEIAQAILHDNAAAFFSSSSDRSKVQPQ